MASESASGRNDYRREHIIGVQAIQRLAARRCARRIHAVASQQRHYGDTNIKARSRALDIWDPHAGAGANLAPPERPRRPVAGRLLFGFLHAQLVYWPTNHEARQTRAGNPAVIRGAHRLSMCRFQTRADVPPPATARASLPPRSSLGRCGIWGLQGGYARCATPSMCWSRRALGAGKTPAIHDGHRPRRSTGADI